MYNKFMCLSRKKSVLGIYYLLNLLIILGTHVSCEQSNSTKSCAQLYEEGVKSYLDNNFVDCVSNFENALFKYRQYSKTVQNCRLSCEKEAEHYDSLYDVDIENLKFFERTIRITLCIVKCKAKMTDYMENFNLNEDVEMLFEKRKPYEYLHNCYFQINELQKAASAVFTYLISHPEDKTMLATFKYYTSTDEVDMNQIVNYEAKDYVYLYSHGVSAYESKDWKDAISNIEESLSDLMHAEDECRAQCEGPFDHGWLPDFIPSIANHFAYCLHCKTKCYSRLNSINAEKHEDLLPSHYDYLQYSYYKEGDLEKACGAVASFLLFSPNDKTMWSNKEFYSKLPGVEQKFFEPRTEAVKYVQRQTYERKLLKFIAEEFQFSVPVSEDFSKVHKTEFIVIQTEQDLKGKKRFVADGLLTKNQCKNIVDIIQTFSIIGDGYDTSSPHTKMEIIKGVTFERIASLVYLGVLNVNHLKMILKVTDDAKDHIQKYFSLEDTLHFSFTHLVCRSALKGSPHNRTDLSHEVHADNCNIYPDGVCEKMPPSYTWRDYSAIIYLNSNFEGGEFFFSSDTRPESIQSSVSPKCGRMVAFSSGNENLHGVKAVRNGSRCAIGLWFTFDSKYRETDRDLVRQLVNNERLITA